MEVLTLAVYLAAVTATELADVPQLSHIRSFLAQSTYNLSKRYRPLYHVSAPFGWINDPAAFVYFKRQYHLFYQYYPYEGKWGPLHWGHAVSNNLADWRHYPAALAPRDPYDRHGCLAGSVAVHGNYLVLFYTGQVFNNNRTRQTQNVAVSSDGVLFHKYFYNPIVKVAPSGVAAFRNPKVWKFRKTWYMLTGTSKRGRGQLALHTSSDLYRWTYNRTITTSAGDLGYLWTNPDVFEIDGVSALVVSAHGVPADGFRFPNLQQTGYVLGRFDHAQAQFDELEVSAATFAELDHGHDFYAAKTMLARDGRRLLVAWLGMWGSAFPEAAAGWAGCMTLVREVRLGRGGRLVTPPAREMARLREETLEDAWYSPGEGFRADAAAFELIVNASAERDVLVALEWGRGYYRVAYSAAALFVLVDRGGADGERRADWSPGPAGRLILRVFVDRSSVEVFVGEGELVFSSRVYPRRAILVRFGGEAPLHVLLYSLRGSVGFDPSLVQHLQDHFIAKNDD